MPRLVVSVVLLGLLALAGCGGAASPSPSAAVATQPPASQPAASQPTASQPAASEPGASTASTCAKATETGETEVTIVGNAFGPDPVSAGVGDVISWTNRDQVPHSAVVDDSCKTATLRNGESGALIFAEAGTYEYVCGIHSNMTGTIEITD